MKICSASNRRTMRVLSLIPAICFALSTATAEEKKPVATPAPVTPKAATPAPPKPKVPAPAPKRLTPVLSINARGGADTIHFIGPDSGEQIAVTALRGKNSKRPYDASREVSYSTAPEGIVSVDKNGFITPLADGKTIITASLAEAGSSTAASSSIPATVSKFAHHQPVSFPNDIVPIFTRNHCNTGACHAKAAGQNGFQLSLLGLDPKADYEHLVNQSRARRIFPASPAHSLLLMKLTGEIPHGGGARIEGDSPDYKMLTRWIATGLSYKPPSDPNVERIEIFPKERILQPGSKQQLVVTAFFDNGTTRDITHMAQYEPNQPDMAKADEYGLVSLKNVTGSTSVMVRFQHHINVFRAVVPLSDKVPILPKPNNLIDREIFKTLTTLGLPASPPCDDGTFLRRVTLDISGRIPTLEETSAFIGSKDPAKRAKAIDRLLDGTDYADNFAGKWAALLRNKVDRGVEWVTRDSHAFHSWIRSSMLTNKPFDQFASELILASGKSVDNPAVRWYSVVKDQKEQMENVAQVFLGIRMKCAQCHHHPYEQWSENDYYAFTAFFSTIKTKKTPKLPEENIVFHNRKEASAKHPGTGEVLKPALLGAGTPLVIPAEQDPRGELVKWIRQNDNPYFARMLVNRYWKHFFSRGMVEPEDDIRPTNPATHPELLEGLARHFVSSGFDLKDLIRTICNSKTYQFQSAPTDENKADKQNFARYYPKRMAAEGLLDAINDLTGAKNSFASLPLGVRAISLPNEKANKESEFLTVFGRPAMDTACECERSDDASLGQSLHLINSDLMQKKLATPGGRAATFAKEKSAATDIERITELYLHALSRQPQPDEIKIATAHLKKKRDQSTADQKKLSPQKADQEAFEDILWVLVNTKEFMYNH